MSCCEELLEVGSSMGFGVTIHIWSKYVASHPQKVYDVEDKAHRGS